MDFSHKFFFLISCSFFVFEPEEVPDPVGIAYSAPPRKTMAAPTMTPLGSWLPNNQILKSKLASLRMLRTMLTVKLDDCADSRLTPTMQRSCVAALRTRSSTGRGTCRASERPNNQLEGDEDNKGTREPKRPTGPVVVVLFGVSKNGKAVTCSALYP